jgi:hypothetical protein
MKNPVYALGYSDRELERLSARAQSRVESTPLRSTTWQEIPKEVVGSCSTRPES